MKRFGILILIAAFGALGAMPAQAQRQHAAGSADRQALRRSLQDIVAGRGGEPDRETRYQAAMADLNGDGRSEAIVYVSGPSSCGSGGCSLYVLSQAPAGWRVVTRTTVTNAPIRLLATRSRGWRDLGVAVSGGGVRAHEAVLTYDGRSYPRNPTIVPARRGRAPAGRVLIADGRQGDLLFPSGGGAGPSN